MLIIIQPLNPMLLGYRVQDKWMIPPDNGQLEVHPTDQQVFRVREFSQNIQYQLQQFERFLMYLRNPYQRNKHMSVINEKTSFFQAISELMKDEHLIIQTFSEKMISYKGFISWILLANSNSCFLIDSATLHDQIYYLQQILQSPKIIKLALNMTEVSRNLKRDFGIFIINVIDLEWLSAAHPKLKDIKQELNTDIQTELQKNYRILVQRPIAQEMSNLIQRYFEMLMDHLAFLPLKPAQEKVSQTNYLADLKYFYEHCNDPQRCLETYRHSFEKFKSEYSVENFTMRQENLINLLVDLREHMARMRDISPLLLLPNPILNSIAKENVYSVLEIAQLYEERNLSVGMQVYNRIYNTIQLNEEKFKDLEGLSSDFLEKYIPNTPAKEKDPNSRDVKKLLRDIKWGQSSQWLNKKDDPSIKLYKQIISIGAFDQSIFEEFIDLMKGEIIKKSQLHRFLKYAQLMRLKNKKNLQQYYGMKTKEDREQRDKEKGKKKLFGQGQFCNPSDYIIDDLEEEEEADQSDSSEEQEPRRWNKGANRVLFGEDDDEEDDEEDERSKIQRQIIDKRIKFKDIKSMTSLDRQVKKEISPKKTEKPASLQFPFRDSSSEMIGSSQTSRKSSDEWSSTQNYLEEEPDRSTIKPLPESIEEIYIQAIEAKKKITKKNTKKKDKKEHRILKKQVEFVPREQDINYLLQLKNNLK